MPTYKQGILARKMHHDVDGKKSGCLPPRGPCLGRCGGSARPHAPWCAQAEDRRLALPRRAGAGPGPCPEGGVRTQQGPNILAPRALC